MIAFAALATLLAAVPAAGESHRGAVIGIAMAGAGAFGVAATGTGGGVTARAMAGYEMARGFTPNLALEGTRFGSVAGSTWEIAALLGLRWYGGLAGRLRSWVEVAAGIGQFVYENNSMDGRVDVGLRLKAAGGLDFAIDPLVSVGVHVAVNDQHADLTDDDRWIDAGCDVTFPF
jgi:hypothetical protein